MDVNREGIGFCCWAQNVCILLNTSHKSWLWVHWESSLFHTPHSCLSGPDCICSRSSLSGFIPTLTHRLFVHWTQGWGSVFQPQSPISFWEAWPASSCKRSHSGTQVVTAARYCTEIFRLTCEWEAISCFLDSTSKMLLAFADTEGNLRTTPTKSS